MFDCIRYYILCLSYEVAGKAVYVFSEYQKSLSTVQTLQLWALFSGRVLLWFSDHEVQLVSYTLKQKLW